MSPTSSLPYVRLVKLKIILWGSCHCPTFTDKDMGDSEDPTTCPVHRERGTWQQPGILAAPHLFPGPGL